MKTRFSLLVGALLALTACQAAPPTPQVGLPAGAGYTDLTPQELQGRLETKDFVFVNTHIPYAGEIAQTDAFIPFDEIDRHLDELPADLDAEIVLYCQSGRMSSIAAETLTGLGYTHVYNLEGGMVAWEQAGLPLIGR